MEEALMSLKEIQKKAKGISRQYALYYTKNRSGHASRGGQGAHEDKMIEMGYSSVEELDRDSKRIGSIDTEPDSKMRALQLSIDRYRQDQHQTDFFWYIKERVDYVLEVHKVELKGTNILTTSEILEAVMPALQYIQFSETPFDGVDLNLDNFDYEDDFCRIVQKKIDGTSEDYGGCLKLIYFAIDKCDEQLSKVVERCSQEENAVSRESFLQIRVGVEKKAEKERTDLTTILKKCDDDIAEIENTSAGLERELKLTTSTFKEAESTLLRKRKDLRTKEHELQQSGASSQSRMEEIKMLRREDIASRTKKRKQDNILMETQKAVTKATLDLLEWGEVIKELWYKVTTSLSILEDMQGCATMIFDKAETQRKEWQKKLALLKADCLKAQDDPLMAQGLIYRLMTYNSECNTQQCKERQNKLQKKLRSAIRYNDEIEKERLQEKIRKCEEDAQKYSKKYDETKTKHDNHVKRMICIQKQLNKVLTASQVMGERIDCDPEERLIQKFEALQARMEAAFEHCSTEHLRLVAN